jgi:redox-sensitive bicupin YhaK (pirin superfamily)
MEPSFIHHGAEDLPVFGEAGVSAPLIAGWAFGLTNPVRTQSPLFYVHAELQAGGRIGIRSEYPEGAAYVVTGRVEGGWPGVWPGADAGPQWTLGSSPDGA